MGRKEVKHTKRPPIFLVTWLDATFEDTETKGGPSVTCTVGFRQPTRWKAHESYSMNVLEDGPWATVHIPKVLIVKKERLDV